MKEYFKINPDEKENIITIIRQFVSNDENIVFACIYGSFLDGITFRDIDIGIYLKNILKNDVFNAELDISVALSGSISKIVKLAFDIIDVRVLNFVPFSFLNNIFKNGQILFSRDDKFLTDLIEKTSIDAISNEYLREQSLRELIPD